jgi:hypothetical protein
MLIAGDSSVRESRVFRSVLHAEGRTGLATRRPVTRSVFLEAAIAGGFDETMPHPHQ